MSVWKYNTSLISVISMVLIMKPKVIIMKIFKFSSTDQTTKQKKNVYLSSTIKSVNVDNIHKKLIYTDMELRE